MSAYRRLKRHYTAADQTERARRGREWYPRMREILDAARGEYELSQAVAAFAITSQGASLKANLAWTERALSGDTYVGRWPNRQAPKIDAALADAALAAEACRGPKIEAFYRAVSGDPDALVLDRWALYAALGHDRASKVTRAQREECERAYHRLAAETGETLRDLQAIVWLHVRETTPHARHGKAPQLWDITA
jgi:hypothetical protein